VHRIRGIKILSKKSLSTQNKEDQSCAHSGDFFIFPSLLWVSWKRISSVFISRPSSSYLRYFLSLFHRLAVSWKTWLCDGGFWKLRQGGFCVFSKIFLSKIFLFKSWVTFHQEFMQFSWWNIYEIIQHFSTWHNSQTNPFAQCPTILCLSE
jgi:hypothetical protein